MKVSVLGCGRWGSFLAWYSMRLGHDVVSFGMEGTPSYEILKAEKKNEYVTFDDSLKLSCDLRYSVERADIIIISISAQGLRGFLEKVTQYDFSKAKFVLCMKGIEEDTGKRLSEVAIESGINAQNLAVWVGPGHIQDFVKGIPNCMVIDSYNTALTEFLANTFKSDIIRFYYGEDIIGTEIGAAMKNIMGIGAGILDGCNVSTLKGPLMSRGCREVARIIKAMGGNELSAYGLCHLGDYETTLFSVHSHNRKWGELFAKGEHFDKLAEGVATASAMHKIAKRLNVELPITSAIDATIRHKLEPQSVIAMLMDREIKKEFY